MKKRVVMGGTVALGILGAALWIHFRFNRGPLYEGKSASYWVEQLTGDRARARRGLHELGPAAAVPALADAVSTQPNWWSRRLDLLRPKLPHIIRRRLPNPAEVDWRRREALGVLYGLGPAAAPAIPALIHFEIESSSPMNPGYSGLPYATMLRIGEAGLPQLAEILERDSASGVRARAAMYLGLLGNKAGAAAPVLAKALSDPNTAVRREAVTALWQIGPSARAALPELKAALRLDDDYFRLQVVHALWDVGRETELTVPILIKVLDDTDNPNRAKAAMILADMGPAARAAVPALTRVLKEEFSYVRVKAEEALKAIDSKLAATAITP